MKASAPSHPTWLNRIVTFAKRLNETFPLVPAIIATIVIVLFKHSLVFFPPYDDQVAGYWMEGVFLVRSNFDYHALRYDEPNVMEGGLYRSYMVSVLPTLVASLSLATGNSSTSLVIVHVLNFLCAGFIAAQVYRMTALYAGRALAIMTSVYVMSMPIMVAPIDTLGMEVPMIAASLWSADAIARGRYGQAAIAGSIAFFVKASGLISLLSSVTFLLVILVLAWRLDRASSTQEYRRGLRWNLAATAISFALMLWSGDPVTSLPDQGWPELMGYQFLALWSPDVALLTIIFVLSIVGTILTLPYPREDGSRSWVWGLQLSCADWARHHPHLLYASIYSLGTWAAVCKYAAIPRYYLPAVPFMAVTITSIVFSNEEKRRWAGVAFFTVMFAFNVFNQEGKLYKDVDHIAADLAEFPSWDLRQGPMAERSGEYRSHHHAMIDAMKIASRESKEHPLFAAINDAVLAHDPILGYVSHSFPKTHCVDRMTYGELVRSFSAAILKSREFGSEELPLVLWTKRIATRVPPPGPHVDILYDNGEEKGRVVLYRIKDQPSWKTAEDIANWYVDITWDNRYAWFCLLDRQSYLTETGRKKKLRELIDRTRLLLPEGDARRNYLAK